MYRLKKDQMFSRKDAITEQVFTRKVPAGTEVTHQKIEKDGETVHVFSIIIDGWMWRATHRDATAKTAASTMQGLENMAAKGSSGTMTEEQRVRRRQRLIEMVKDGLHLLIYDIPDVLKDEAPNPSCIFWNYGFRLNLSCWVFPSKALESAAIKEVTDHWDGIPFRDEVIEATGDVKRVGVEWHKFRFADDEVENLQRMAHQRLDAELKAIKASVKKRINDAATRLAKAKGEIDNRIQAGEFVSTKEQEKPANLHIQAVRTALNDAIESWQSARKSAEVFDVSADLEDLLESVRYVIVTEGRIFNADASARSRMGVKLPV